MIIVTGDDGKSKMSSAVVERLTQNIIYEHSEYTQSHHRTVQKVRLLKRMNRWLRLCWKTKKDFTIVLIGSSMNGFGTEESDTDFNLILHYSPYRMPWDDHYTLITKLKNLCLGCKFMVNPKIADSPRGPESPEILTFESDDHQKCNLYVELIKY